MIGKGRRAERDKRCEGELECKGVRRGREVGKKEVFLAGENRGEGEGDGRGEMRGKGRWRKWDQ